jgi:hypothetical protein
LFGDPKAGCRESAASSTLFDVTLDAVWDVLKWVLLVLAAGFIGQFGKSLALHLLERRRKRAAEAAPSPDREPFERGKSEEWAKVEKKRAKADVKRSKKAGSDRSKDG